MKAEIKHRSNPFLPFGFPLYLRLMRIKWCGVVCVTFKFVCFDGIEGKNLADEVLRKKKKKKEEEGELCGTFWGLEEVVWKKRGKKEKRKRVRVRVWRRKKEGKRKRKKKEMR